MKEQDNLREAISLLKKKQTAELKLLKEQFHIVHESVKPINLIKNLLHQVASSPDIKNGIVGNLIGLASGFISKKLFVGSSHNPITRLVGTFLQMGVTNITSKNSDFFKSIGEKVFQFISKKVSDTKLKNSIADQN